MKRLLSIILVASSLFTTNAFAEMVNINKASAEVMQKNLKGIGVKKAEAIISYRTEHGEFKKLEDIKEVKGIGDALFEKIKADISLDQGLSVEGAAGAEGKATTEKKSEEKVAKSEDKAAKEAKPSASKATDKVE
ncbi:helix-hairpin-helix domain-containing protein [uncultured Thiothrix sp.]|uniref:ComEA family DNA-binding protein n=1 Tax=uncultured Thiothrix sp. TaxID=223185 RepID=UPI002629270A|nr:helix-hairpin-helix domain-containing protein [uncultured Thiothrix sp.]